MARAKWRDIDGVLLLDKPAGLSSNDALQIARRIFRARKGGHGGTLDPLATGLLPIAFGQGTKFINDLVEADKTYLATIQLGQSSTTGDAEGDITPADPDRVLGGLSPMLVNETLLSLTGEIDQVPPMYSAVKHQGKPLYAYARKGHHIERIARRITVHRLELTRFDALGTGRLELRVVCSKGTYIRVLAEDIGAHLGCGAYLAQLRREGVGQFEISEGVCLDRLKSLVDDEPALMACLRPVDTMLAALPGCEIPVEQAARFRHGQAVPLDFARFESPKAAPDAVTHSVPAQAVGSSKERCRVYAHSRFLGLADIDNNTLAPRRLVVEPSSESTPSA